jgi:predicted phage gp36 major capsid-like protein
MTLQDLHVVPEPSSPSRPNAAQPRPVYRVEQEKPGGPVTLTAANGDEQSTGAAVLKAMGSSSTEFAAQQVNFLLNATAGRGRDANERAFNSALAAVAGVEPRDELEAQLGVQMAAVHGLAMQLLRRAAQASETEQMVARGNMATKLLRTYAAQIEALARWRSKGMQTVRFEHVNVHEGGQAIVGNIVHEGRG